MIIFWPNIKSPLSPCQCLCFFAQRLFCNLFEYLVQDVANQKEARIQKSDDTITDGGESDQGQRANGKPEDLLKLIMTTDETSQNKMMFPAPSKEPGEMWAQSLYAWWYSSMGISSVIYNKFKAVMHRHLEWGGGHAPIKFTVARCIIIYQVFVIDQWRGSVV